jgi:hypothetical protein
MDKKKKLRLSKETLGSLSSTRLAAAQGAITTPPTRIQSCNITCLSCIVSCLGSCNLSCAGTCEFTCQYTCTGSADICCA